jgi:hypothetical protein
MTQHGDLGASHVVGRGEGGLWFLVRFKCRCFVSNFVCVAGPADMGC